jgi:hypothetical protein
LLPLDEAGLRLDHAFPSGSIDAHALKSNDDIDIQALVKASGVLTYPVRQGERIVSSVTVAAKSDGVWSLESVGSANQVRAIAAIRDTDASESGRDPAGYFVVTVPALKAVLLGYNGHDGVVLSDVIGNDSLGMRAGEWQDAAKVLRAVARAIKPRKR